MRPTSSLPILVVLVSISQAFSTRDQDSSETRALMSRQNVDTCTNVDSRLPGAFKCGSGTNCLSLDNGTSALCCPDGNTCNNIATIPCDVTLQDASKNPDATIFTTRTGDRLPTCGSKCCPFGYSCIASNRDDNSVCSLILGLSKSGRETTSSASSASSSAPSAPTASSSSTAAATSSRSTTSPPTSSSTASTVIASGSSATATKEGNKFPTGIFAGGIGVGILVGILLALIWVIGTGRHKKPDNRNSTGSSTAFKPQISDPIPMQSSGRTEFLRRTGQRAISIFSSRDSQLPTQNDPTQDNWKMPTPPTQNNIHNTAPTSSAYPVTPERRLPRESTAETIKIYSPPTVPAVPPNIAPLRGMNASRFANDRDNFNERSEQGQPMGSPFQTPPGLQSNPANDDRSIYPDDDRVTGQRALSSYSDVSSLHDLSNPGAGGPETLAAARYNGDNVSSSSNAPQNFNTLKSRPTTTFTEMLHDVGFPDPYKIDEPVPPVPSRYGKS
ncbi:hypothetical protein PV10_02020 [Exophiala mesophila]|uniref:Mid2 domain-containing protein n=1 Tax=Exophiala mesophila TaxID=212818 RepID=A0A0D2A5D8_EXOME|nr:uncharacterized protein PV10_02020 [Exophiala mesophila]KIV94233.1 hypothetical protein PV10_02020 [Exophiala mesophila]